MLHFSQCLQIGLWFTFPFLLRIWLYIFELRFQKKKKKPTHLRFINTNKVEVKKKKRRNISPGVIQQAVAALRQDRQHRQPGKITKDLAEFSSKMCVSADVSTFLPLMYPWTKLQTPQRHSLSLAPLLLLPSHQIGGGGGQDVTPAGRQLRQRNLLNVLLHQRESPSVLWWFFMLSMFLGLVYVSTSPFLQGRRSAPWKHPHKSPQIHVIS